MFLMVSYTHTSTSENLSSKGYRIIFCGKFVSHKVIHLEDETQRDSCNWLYCHLLRNSFLQDARMLNDTYSELDGFFWSHSNELGYKTCREKHTQTHRKE